MNQLIKIAVSSITDRDRFIFVGLLSIALGPMIIARILYGICRQIKAKIAGPMG